MNLIDVDSIEYEPMLVAKGNGDYEEVMIAHKDQIDTMPIINYEDLKFLSNGTFQVKTDVNIDDVRRILISNAKSKYCTLFYANEKKKKGKWKIKDYPMPDWVRIECTACGEPMLQFLKVTGYSRYCPNCGARMEEDDETD